MMTFSACKIQCLQLANWSALAHVSLPEHPFDDVQDGKPRTRQILSIVWPIMAKLGKSTPKGPGVLVALSRSL